MRPAALIALALKLAIGSDRGAKLRLALMSLSIGVGVAVIIGAFSAIPAIQARDARLRGLDTRATDRPPDDPHLITTTRDSWFEGRSLRIVLVAPVGDAPVPPGLDRIPLPGEVVVSPVLDGLLRGPKRSLLDDRLPGGAIGEVDETGLLHPDELIAYLGVHPNQIDEIERAYVTGFGLPSSYDQGVPLEVIQTVVFGSMGVLLPVLVFVWTATRLSAGLRETRLAAIRLAGATPRQVRLLASVESGLAAVIGTGVGFALFLGLRELLAIPVELGLEPRDAFPPIQALIGVAIGIPALSVLVAWLALRRIVRMPLRVARGTRRRMWVAGPAAVALAFGIGLWLTSRWVLDRWGDNGALWVVFILGAWILTALGVLGTAPWAGTRAIGWIVGRSEGLGAWLGARRLRWDGRAASRISAATVAVVFTAGITAGYLVYFEGSAGAYRTAASLLPETIVVDSWEGNVTDMADEIAAVSGVRSTTAMRVTHVAGRDRNFLSEIAIVSCANLGAVLRSTPVGCAPGAILSDRPADDVTSLRRSRDLQVFAGPPEEYIPLPVEIDGVVETSFDAAPWSGGYVIDEAAVPVRTLEMLPATRLLVATDGRPETVERVREAIAWDAPFAVLTPSELAAREQGTSIPVRLVIEIGTWFALSVVAASLLVSTVGAMQERRKPLAALAALGVPARSLRMSVLVQTMTPLVSGVLLAGMAAAVVVLSSAPDRPAPISLVAPIGRFVVIAVIAGLVASALAFPSLRRGIRPDALHHE